MLRSVSFTQNREFLCASLEAGFAVFSTNPWASVVRCPTPDQVTNFAVAFPRSSLAVFAGAKGQRSFSERSVCVYDWSKRRPISDIECPEAIANILSVGQLFALVFQSEVRLYNCGPPSLAAQFHCAPNPAAPCDAAERDGQAFVALTGRQPGYLKIVSASSMSDYRELPAANHPLTMIRFSRDASFVATASERGTLIKVINARTGDIVGEFRRGSFHATIASIAFAPGGKSLVAYSDKGTVHLFALDDGGAGTEKKRAVAIWRTDGFQPAVVEFLSVDTFAVLKFAPGEVEVLKCDGNVIASQSKLLLASLR
jgi:WD40 repeat protein